MIPRWMLARWIHVAFSRLTVLHSSPICVHNLPDSKALWVLGWGIPKGADAGTTVVSHLHAPTLESTLGASPSV
jgi:hypothetical protein